MLTYHGYCIICILSLSDRDCLCVPVEFRLDRSNLLKAADFVSVKQFVNSNRKQVQLMIRAIQISHFTNYYLLAENDISSAEVTIVILPASLELSQMPSSQDQMMFFVRQQLPQTGMEV